MAADPDALRAEVVQVFDAAPVVDAATGGGASIDLLRSRGLFAVATDLEAEKIAGRQPAVVCDIRRLPFRPGSLAGVLFSFCLHHVHDAADRASCITWAARLLRRGGVMAIADWREPPDFHKDWPMPQPDRLSEAARAAGLVVEQYELRGKLFKLILRKPTC